MCRMCSISRLEAALGESVLALCYWNSLANVNSIGLKGANDTGNAAGNQFVAANLNKTYSAPYWLRRLTSAAIPGIDRAIRTLPVAR
jgi:hypothetical protein